VFRVYEDPDHLHRHHDEIGAARQVEQFSSASRDKPSTNAT
jgi:hypothetical protein